MAVTGKRFMCLSKSSRVSVTLHALARICEHTGCRVSEEEAMGLFQAAVQVSAEKLFILGYRPAYGGRLSRGCKTWYFHFDLCDQELMAVVTEGELLGDLVWVTTYARTPQVEQYRIGTYAMLQLG